jgi:Tol biopolymer transport system component
MALRGQTWLQRTLLLGVIAGLGPQVASAQYFGQNKVQYERFDYQVLRTETFDIYHYPEEAEAVRLAAPLAERWRERLARDLGFDLRGRQPLILYASHPHFTQTQVIEGLIGEGTGGVTEYLKRRMVLPFASSLGETSHVLGHELVHAFQYDGGSERALMLPLWFIEGMAEYLTIGDDDPHTAMWLRDLATREALPSFEDLNDPQYFPYRVGHAAWAYLAARFGVSVVGRGYLAASRSGDAIAGIEEATGVDIDELTAGWHADIRRKHGEPRGRLSSKAVISGDRQRGGRINVSPAISPDGRWIAYLSERSQFSIDLYLADAATGRVVRRLTRTETDPHFESLQFVGSAGAWDASSRRLAFVGISGGHPTITVVDVSPGGDTREWTLAEIDEAWHPTWSPDGRQLALSGLRGGVSDLYTFDLDARALRRVTDDPFADRQPAWSPDGRRLAFVTDRFVSDADDAGSRATDRLALLTVADGNIVEVTPPGYGKQINPQWGARGERLFFIADPDGVANVYQVELPTGSIARLTDVATGVSGLTASSPALSVAPSADRIAISVFRDGGYDIHVLDAATPQPDGQRERTAARLFDAQEDVGRTLALAIPTSKPPAPSATTSAVEAYHPELSLDFAGASGGVGMASRYGAFVGGGVGMLFSDMVGHHTLAVIAEANGGIQDIGGQVTYLNRTSRWNWGGAALVRPYVTGGFTQQLTQLDGQTVLLNEEHVFRQTDAELRGLAFYPFNRAARLEFQAGGRRIWFDRQLTTRAFSSITGEFLGEDRQDLDAPAALNLAEGAVALVYDQSVFGPTSPIAGQRHRAEITPAFGSLRFTTATVDLRRYFALWRPFTLAVRGLHVGRYGGDAEDARLSPLFLGYPSLVRGYNVGSFDERDCGTTPSGDCPAFDTLIGSRIAVGNAELRFPLFGAFNGEYRYGPLPIEAFLFADTGVAWSSTLDPEFAGGDRRFVSSVGAGARVNLFGYMVGEIALARPLDRPARGWVFSFNLMPGY